MEKETNSEKILLYLFNYLNDYDEIKSLIKSLNLDISNIFLPNSLMAIDKALDENMKLCLQLVNFIEIVKFYSFLLYDDEDHFVNRIKNIIKKTRYIYYENKVLGKNSFDSILFNAEGGLDDLLDNNVSLVSLYIFSLISQIQSQ